jgi:murein DD-endopeptidase MepM/ murein hydrolase activator NlpD
MTYKKLLFAFFLLVLSSFLPQSSVLASTQSEIDQLNQEIKDKTAAVDELNAKIRAYQETIAQKQDDEVNLQNQIGILEEDIAKTEAEISKTETEISKLSSEIKLVSTKIDDTQSDISTKQEQISSYLLNIYQLEQKTNLEIFLTNDTLSSYFSRIEYAKQLQQQFQDTVNQLKTLKDELKTQQDELDASKVEEENKKATLDVQNRSLEGERTYKDNMLAEVMNDEQKFQELVQKVKQEQAQTNAQIDSLEKQMRTKLEQMNPDDNTDSGPFVMPTNFSPQWPVNSTRVTAYFHDSSYPFKAWFEHDAIDIGVGQGTPVYAADGGVVAIAKHDGTTAYSYIMIIHADGFATLYGHMSEVYVQPDQKINKGETIGLSGGMPGTTGAGAYTTGPHLHFGVRLNGIPVDPLNYLP